MARRDEGAVRAGGGGARRRRDGTHAGPRPSVRVAIRCVPRGELSLQLGDARAEEAQVGRVQLLHGAFVNGSRKERCAKEGPPLTSRPPPPPAMKCSSARSSSATRASAALARAASRASRPSSRPIISACVRAASSCEGRGGGRGRGVGEVRLRCLPTPTFPSPLGTRSRPYFSTPASSNAPSPAPRSCAGASLHRGRRRSDVQPR